MNEANDTVETKESSFSLDGHGRYPKRPGVEGDFAPGDLVRAKEDLSWAGYSEGETFLVDLVDWDLVEMVCIKRDRVYGASSRSKIQGWLCDLVKPALPPQNLPEDMHGSFYYHQHCVREGWKSIDDLADCWAALELYSDDKIGLLKAALSASPGTSGADAT